MLCVSFLYSQLVSVVTVLQVNNPVASVRAWEPWQPHKLSWCCTCR
jgi:hypothetical protein